MMINNIIKYWVINGDLIVLNGNILSNVALKKEIVLNDNSSVINERKYFSDVFNDKAVIYNSQLLAIEAFERQGLISVNVVNDDRYVLRLERAAEDYYEYFEGNNFLSIPFKYFRIIEGVFLAFNQSGINTTNELSRINWSTFDKVWTYSLSQYPQYVDDFGDERVVEIEGEIKLHENILLVPCYNHIFLCLDASTGKLVWKNDDIKGYFPVYYHQSVIFMTAWQFLELDILTGKIIRDVNVSKIFKDNDLVINATWHNTIIYKGKIYRVYSSQFFITKMDYHTLAYEGKIEIKKTTKKSWQIGEMKIHGDKLYILEWTEKDKNLHIIDLN